MKTTINQVASLAGVSIATVSRVINGIDNVNPETRDKILRIVADLKYTPNLAARGLITKKTEAIGLLLPDLHGEFFSEVIRGVDEAVQRQNYHLLVSSSHNDRKEIEAALKFMRGRVDGLIIMSPQVDSDILLANLPKSLPAVLLNCHIDNPHYDTIVIDGFGGARDMVSYLLSIGHTRVAVIKGGDNNSESQERLRGYRTALNDYGIHYHAGLEFDGDFTEASGFESAKKILEMKPRPTAIFASNDSMAIGAIGAIREAGLRIPDDISICGFDDIPVAKYLSPSLTSVHVPIHDLGVMAITRLFSRLLKLTTEEKSQTFVKTTVCIRDSCAPIHQTHRRHKESEVA
jgi:LacI family transcriptional regulator